MNGKNPEKIFEEISAVLGIPVRAEEKEMGGPLRKTYDIGAMFSKIMALAVYVGSPISANLPVLLNQVHADIEWWKARLGDEEKETPEEIPAEDTPATPVEEPQKETPAPEVPSEPAPEPKPEETTISA